MSIKTETDKVWVGTKRGVVKITGEEWELYTKKNSSLPSNLLQTLQSEYHRIWIGTTKGVVSYNGSEWKRYCKKKKINTVFNVYVDKSDNKWISTEDALIVFNEQGVSCFTNKSPTKKNYFRVLNNTKIEYILSNSTNVEIKIYNIQEETVDVITEEKNLN